MILRRGWAIALAVLSLVIVIILHRASPDRWSGMASDIYHSLHGPGFALLAVATLWILPRQNQKGVRFAYLTAAAIVFAVGVVAEAAQIPGPRDAQVSDLLVNGLGIAGGLGTVALFDQSLKRELSRNTRALVLVVCVPVLIYACIPTVSYSYAFVQQLRAVPELLTFEHIWERPTYGQPGGHRPKLIAGPADWPISGSTIARTSEQGRWGIFLSLHPARDWSAYSRISFIASTTDGMLAVAVGIRDMRPARKTYENRFYKRVNASTLPQRYYIEFDEIRAAMTDRPFDFAHIESVVFSASRPGSVAHLLIDDIRLEP